MKRKKKTGKHNPDVIEQAWQLRQQGLAHKIIGEKLGVSVWCLADWFGLRTQPGVNMRMARKYGAAHG